ncbi:hypothetical protein Rsub_10908 [Raphidocelis subcapitata]|uniref:FAS1 domain-containing protein n=1 Tax=Raphidocelis subcapitata TaxID=307507 RepID=A0A2V0PD19_9CHLO|nr:hypothetical protein Rsub_10908 [Raphidocelis subcapitata]|eukprot:GBF97744.1 hypothetical protein Rsub_10908 [Raphidocelis subcapitata]
MARLAVVFALVALSPNLSKLKAALYSSGLADTFSNKELAVTVFVPNNDAYSAAEAKYGSMVSSLMANQSLMKQMVYSNVLKGVIKAPFPKSTVETYVTGTFLNLDNYQVQAKGSSANVKQANIVCGKGLAHVVDNVLLMVDLSGGR